MRRKSSISSSEPKKKWRRFANKFRMWSRMFELKKTILVTYAAFIFFAACPSILASQTVVTTKSSPATDSILRAAISLINKKQIEKLPIGERVAAIGKLFLGKPYID